MPQAVDFAGGVVLQTAVVAGGIVLQAAVVAGGVQSKSVDQYDAEKDLWKAGGYF